MPPSYDLQKSHVLSSEKLNSGVRNITYFINLIIYKEIFIAMIKFIGCTGNLISWNFNSYKIWNV